MNDISIASLKKSLLPPSLPQDKCIEERISLLILELFMLSLEQWSLGAQEQPRMREILMQLNAHTAAAQHNAGVTTVKIIGALLSIGGGAIRLYQNGGLFPIFRALCTRK